MAANMLFIFSRVFWCEFKQPEHEKLPIILNGLLLERFVGTRTGAFDGGSWARVVSLI